jgi:hypothetical protein
VELTARDLALACVEVVGHGVHTCRIAYEHYSVGQLFRLQMEMKTRTVGIDDQF